MAKGRLVITALIIILLVVYYLWGMDYKKQNQEHEVLTSQIADARETLAHLPKLPPDLEQRLAVARASLAAEQKAVPSKMNSNQVVDIILELADNAELKAIPLVTRPWATEVIGEHEYYVFRLNVEVGGSFTQLVNFVSGLENGELKTLIVENLTVSRVTDQTEAETSPEGTIPITGKLDLAIYAQPPVSN